MPTQGPLRAGEARSTSPSASKGKYKLPAGTSMGALSGLPLPVGVVLCLSQRLGEEVRGAAKAEQWEGMRSQLVLASNPPVSVGAGSVITSKAAAVHPGPRGKTGWGVIVEMGPPEALSPPGESAQGLCRCPKT